MIALMRWRTRRAVSAFSVHIGSRTAITSAVVIVSTGIAIGNNDACTLLEKELGDTRANAARRAADQGDPVLEPSGHPHFPSKDCR